MEDVATTGNDINSFFRERSEFYDFFQEFLGCGEKSSPISGNT
jgi:hypothetical protein